MADCLSAHSSLPLLPTASEAVLVALLLTDAYSVWLLLLVATVGNVLGAVVNWLLGRGLSVTAIDPGSQSNPNQWAGRSTGTSVTASGRCC
jgi:membrane protein YqaA with SNARE-associated domain